MVAMDLGHGDGRGRYVVQVYGQKLPPERLCISIRSDLNPDRI